jgi:plasmid maintenance system antidote protein VapI
MNIWEKTDYKEILRAFAEVRGHLTTLAKAAKCQPSYLLRVLNEESHLTPDQAYRISEYLRHAADEREYFLTLVELARAADEDYRLHLRNKLEKLLEARHNLINIVKRNAVSETQSLLEYHRDWRISFIHFLSACSFYQSKERMAGRMHVSLQELENLILPLKSQGHVQADAKSIKFKTGTGHIPAGSSILPIFLGNWRALAAQKSATANPKTIHYTNVQTIGKSDIQKLIALASQFIQKSKSVCDESASEEVVAINLDVFVP